MAKINNKIDPVKTGVITYNIFAFEITPNTAIAPAGGCKHRNICPRLIAIETAIAQDI